LTALRACAMSDLRTAGIKARLFMPRRRSRARGSARAIRMNRLVICIVAVEFSTVAATCFVTSLIYFKMVLTAWPPAEQYVAAALIIAGIVSIASLGFKQHLAIQAQPRDRYFWSALGAATLAFSCFLSLLFLFKIADWYSRGTFLFQFLSVSAALLVARGSIHTYVYSAIKSGSVEARKAVLVGDAKANSRIVKRLQQFGVRYAGVLPFPQADHKGNASAGALALNVDAFVDQCRAVNPDDVIFLTAPTDLPRIAGLVDALSVLPVTAHIVPTEVNDLWTSAKSANLGETATIQVLRPPLSDFDQTAKRAFDICVAGFSLIALSPLLFMVSLAIKLDSPGPILFRQNRHGYNNEVIPVLKFRTMTVVEDGETTKTFTQAKANDVRLTRLGRMLRQTNIDELTQLFNVLQGQMSIVGPRPHPIALNAMFQERIALFSRRHKVKPGLTGWAQVHGWRGETETVEKMRQRVEHDLYYIEHWSFLMDLKIILMTLFSKSAYHNAC
jgi:Undecaprenyl-phosphate glucose phosphotransferase